MEKTLRWGILSTARIAPQTLSPGSRITSDEGRDPPSGGVEVIDALFRAGHCGRFEQP
ncbi:hypothetical protein [Rhizobium sp. A37_96]